MTFMARSFLLLRMLMLLSEPFMSECFTPNKISQYPGITSILQAQYPTAEDSAKALQDYMAKAHEEKLRALRQLESQKDAQLSTLKTQLANLRRPTSTSGTPAPTPPETTPTIVENEDIKDLKLKINYYQKFVAKYIVDAQAEKARAVKEAGKEVPELKEKIAYYQSFMAKYIVDSQADKARAVAEAEAKLKKQFAEKLASSEISSEAPATLETLPQKAMNPLFAKRNKMVAAAGAAGKSRWGEMEVAKAKLAVESASASAPTEPVVQEKAVNPLFEMRNQRVAAAGAAGKSRWGEMEVAKAQAATSSAPSSIVEPTPVPEVVLEVSPEIIAADHGLHREGSVSLAERVILGIGATDSSTPSSPAITKEPTLYEKRNERVAAAGKNSRWGEAELLKVTKIVSGQYNGVTNGAVAVPPAANGAEKELSINVGAQILASA